MTLKQNTEFKKRFDEYIEKHSRKTEKNKIKTLMKQIRHGLARGADKKTIFNFFRDEKILNLSYNSFCRYLRELEHEDNTQVEHKDHSNVTETTQVSPNKSPQQAPETTQTVVPKSKKQQDTQETEEREFGKLPKGKVWSELSEELKETIRSERRQLDAEAREKRKQQQIEAAVAEREASKLHHNPNT